MSNPFSAIMKLLNWGLYFISKHINTETIKCKQCKGTMTSRKQYLALLPVFFDETYEASAVYYQNCTIPIESEEEIPTGRRACYIHVFQCENCGKKLISVVDFLKVREQFLIKGGENYPYDDFRTYIENRS